jgi:hypothetical protein
VTRPRRKARWIALCGIPIASAKQGHVPKAYRRLRSAWSARLCSSAEKRSDVNGRRGCRGFFGPARRRRREGAPLFDHVREPGGAAKFPKNSA